MADAEIDASELVKAIRELEEIPKAVILNAHITVESWAEKLRNRWRANARSTAGTHGVHYPKAITAASASAGVGDVAWEVGPESALPQGGMGMGFEYGSVNQPPHLDGQRAQVVIEPLFVKAVEEMIGKVL